MDCIVGVDQSIVRTEMNCPSDLASRSLNTLHIAFSVECASHLDTEVDSHCLISAFRMVIEK